jgi:hypothetical protein
MIRRCTLGFILEVHFFGLSGGCVSKHGFLGKNVCSEAMLETDFQR